MPPESTLCMLSPKPFIMVICMNTRKAVAGRDMEGIANVGAHDNQAPLQDNQVPPPEQVSMGD